MKKLAALALLVPVAAAAQMGGGMTGGGGMMGGRGMMANPRHAYVMRHGIDPKYARARNPLEPSAANLEAGGKLYRLNCAVCHGDSGLGNEAGQKLEPPAARLAGLSRTPIATDGFYDWTISEGGVPLRSAMPPFKNVLKQEDIWKIVLYLRSL